MANTHRLAGTVTIDALPHDWELRREPKWSESEGWKGMAVALVRQGAPREAVLEFPTPKRLLKGLPPSRLQISDALVSRGIRAALQAGWSRCRAASPW